MFLNSSRGMTVDSRYEEEQASTTLEEVVKDEEFENVVFLQASADSRHIERDSELNLAHSRIRAHTPKT